METYRFDHSVASHPIPPSFNPPHLPTSHLPSTKMAPHLPYRLDGKVALVTGSGRGIGAAMATELGRAGAKVVVNYANSEASALKVVQAIKDLGSDAIALKADVRDVSQTAKLMDEAIAHYGGLDIVCSNAGVVSFGHIGDVTEVSGSIFPTEFQGRGGRRKTAMLMA